MLQTNELDFTLQSEEIRHSTKNTTSFIHGNEHQIINNNCCGKSINYDYEKTHYNDI